MKRNGKAYQNKEKAVVLVEGESRLKELLDSNRLTEQIYRAQT